MFEAIDRRALLQGGASFGALLLAAGTGGCEDLLNKIRNRPVRKNVATIDPNGSDLTAYRAAINAMKALPSSDCRSWVYQANIHFNHCPHGNWFFLPWHRAYLFYFEQICREMSGDQSFALPYWNWQAQPSVPAPFWAPAPDPLNYQPRSATQASVIAPGITDPPTMESIQALTDFQMYASFMSTAPRGGTGGGYGQLEATPHNYVHGFVGGTMGTYQSPLDPIFWTHHCMIDACWVDWNIKRQHANTNDSNWLNYEFTEFCNGQGTPTPIKVVATILMPLLSYRYDDPVIGQPTTLVKGALDAKALRKFLETGAPSKFVITQRIPIARGLEVAAGKASLQRVQLSADMLGQVQQGRQMLLLNVGDAQPPPQNDVFVRVFLGKPDATADTPTTDPHYAGSFAFFEDPEAEKSMNMPMKRDFLVNLSGAAERLTKAGEMANGATDVTFVTVPFSTEKAATATGFNLKTLDLVLSPTGAPAN
jgi:tyrosinase